MRVRVGSYYLAGDPAAGERKSSQAAVTRMTPQQSIQTVNGMRWDKAQRHDRQNEYEIVEFETRIEFPDILTAQTWMFSGMRQTIPRFGNVDFIEDVPETNNYQFFTMTNCLIMRPTRVPAGVSIKLIYRIIGDPPGAIQYGTYPQGAVELESGAGDIQLQSGGKLDLNNS